MPVQVSDDFLEKIFLLHAASKITVDVDKQTITINDTGEQEHFEINNYKKTCLLNGYDDIDFLISIKEDVLAYEKNKELAEKNLS